MNWNTIKTRAQGLLSQQGLTVTATIGRDSIQGVRTVLKRSDINSDAGLIEGRYEFSLLASRADFPLGLPQPRKTKVTIDEVEYRLISIETDPLGATVRLNLGGIL